MANGMTSAIVLSSPSMEQQQQQPPPYIISKKTFSQQNQNVSNGPIAILWDMENCPVPSDVRPEDVAGNIRMALRVHPIITGAVNMFSAYGDFNGFPRRLREGCQRTGVKLIDVPNGRKDAADKAILVDMFLFALDNPPPSSIMLISGDVDFSHALHVLGQRGYTVILVIPSGVGVSSALSNAGSYVWDWPCLVRGEGFVPSQRSRAMWHADVAQICDTPDVKNEEESIVYRGVSTVSKSSSDLTWVQPGDLTGLKGQLVKLLEASGGSILLGRLPADYQKTFGRPLNVSEYGTLKLVNLLKKFNDVISVEGQGHKKLVLLKKSTEVNRNLDKKGKGVLSSDEYSDELLVYENQEEKNLSDFSIELQEILVSYSCRIFLSCFEAIYQQRYKRRLNYKQFGVNNLEELFEKMKELVTVYEEPVSKRKYMVANAV